MGPLDFSKIGGIEEADEQDEDTVRSSRREEETEENVGSGSKGNRLISPQAERARNSLAERNRAVNMGENGE
jgi:hypothetical protein